MIQELNSTKSSSLTLIKDIKLFLNIILHDKSIFHLRKNIGSLLQNSIIWKMLVNNADLHHSSGSHKIATQLFFYLCF